MSHEILYVSDLDGTLLNDHANLSDYTKEIINCLIKQGVKFTYATARSYSSASQILNGLNLAIPAITYNGAFFVKQEDGEILESVQFAQDTIWYLKEAFQKHKLSPLVYSILDGRERVSWIKGCETKGILRYLETRKDDPRLLAVSNEEKLFEGNIFYFTMIGERESLDLMRESLDLQEQGTFGFRYLFQEEIYYSGEYWLEIMPREATKAEGVRRLKEVLGCDQVVCFGDGINDIPLFEIANQAYAVENAVFELKRLATSIIGNNTQDGVARWFVEQNIVLK